MCAFIYFSKTVSYKILQNAIYFLRKRTVYICEKSDERNSNILLYSKASQKLNMLFCNVNSQEENIMCSLSYLFLQQNLLGDGKEELANRL